MSNTMLKSPPNFFERKESDSINWELIFKKTAVIHQLGGKQNVAGCHIYLFPRIRISMYPLYAPLPGLHRLTNHSFYEKNRRDFLHKLHWVKTVKIVCPVFQAYDQIYLWEAISQAVSVIPNRRVEGRSNLVNKVANYCLMCVPRFCHPHTA